MGRVGAFLEVDRRAHGRRDALESISDMDEIVTTLPKEEQELQASRCMNCGVAFCQSGIHISGSRRIIGCPLQNLIPETNDLICKGRWDEAVSRLLLTNPFPEFTGRVCPAPCEDACNLGLHENSVTIHDDERAMSDYMWQVGVDPLPKAQSTSPLVTVIGSGPAGLAAAWELTRLGYQVRVIERAKLPGGLLMYGIPNMKLDKDVVCRRINLMKESGIVFDCGIDATDIAEEILESSKAILIACGASIPRDMPIAGRDLNGVHFAVDYLSEVTDAMIEDRKPSITAYGKDVVVIGGGDTGIDCVACALRQGASSVTQVIRAARPVSSDYPEYEWPLARSGWTQGYGQAEAEALFGEDPRIWSVDTLAFEGNAAVEGVRICDLSYDGGRHIVEDTQRTIPAQLVLIAKGFLGSDKKVLDAFGADTNDTTIHVFVAGDARTGASIVANAMADGIATAKKLAHKLG